MLESIHHKKDRLVREHLAACNRISIASKAISNHQVNRPIAARLRAVYFFLEKVYDKLITETISEEKLIIITRTSKVVIQHHLLSLFVNACRNMQVILRDKVLGNSIC